ncbi:hypothetical protein J2Z69_001701 [Paenibacillus shirakamiensis]|uniref:DUF3885 domain-containing protein n=1 Tax=Paenibacillus shirakamiensis TaxID=1265935 RepID=A0ABS4JG18_9BACL|nr:hypothetical protein [Paenibacillus shirakamiensis]MBP2000670.1 hypothetical protein [Paenibacillus shirakamiensis]
MNNVLTDFMQKYFNTPVLEPGLFYNSQYGLRFEISQPSLDFYHPNNQEQIYQRATTLFQSVFEATDNILLVTQVYCDRDHRVLQRKPLNIYRKYIRNRSLLRQLQHKILPPLITDDRDESYAPNEITHQFVLPCTTSDIRYVPLLSAIWHEDFKHLLAY